MPNGAAIPVETLLKLTLDKAGSQTIKDFLDEHEQSWGRIEQAVNRVGSGIEGIARFGLGLAGAAGVGAIVNNFMQTSEYGSQVALAAGRVTGGPGVWHPYSQGLLADQRKTGVGASDIAQGLVMAVQALGGNPSPQQAMVLGGLLAGISQTEGLSPAQIAQVTNPILQASNKSLTPGNTGNVWATIQQGLTNFPGSQSAPLLSLIASLATQQALGGGSPQVGGTVGLLNAAAGANAIWRNPQTVAAATQGISSGLQGAYTNPSMEAFLQIAGVSYQEQRAGFGNPQTIKKILDAANRLYPNPTVRDMALRSMFGGIPGADLLETYDKHGMSAVNQALSTQAKGGSLNELLRQLQHPQTATTPHAEANKLGGGILGWLESSSLHALLGVAGLIGGPTLLRKGFGLAGKGAGSLARLLRGGGSSAADDAAGSAVEDAAGGGLLDELIGSSVGGAALGVAGAYAASMINPDSTSAGPRGSTSQILQLAVHNALKLGVAKYGRNGLRTKAARDYMQKLIYSDGASIYGGYVDNPSFPRNVGQYQQAAGKLLDQALGDEYAPQLAAANPATKLSQAADELMKAAEKLQRGGYASYTPGSSQATPVGLGTPAIQGLDSLGTLGAEFASLQLGGGGGSSGGQFVSLLGLGASAPSGGGGGGSAGTGWQSCMLTWYDPALGGTNSASGRPDPHSPTASGTPYSASAMTCAAPPAYAFGTKIEFAYGGKTVTCTVNDRGGAIQGAHFDLARGPANALGMIQSGVVHAKFRVLSSGGGGGHSSSTPGQSGSASTGSGSTVSDVATRASAGTGLAGLAATHHATAHPHAADQRPVHVHVYVDGHPVRASRVLRGHHP